ncbi:MAG: type II secretion system GspH family protein [Burkholderiaceae bacterium]|nr:type II secretion system GspH family protein [Burkholderiaceae bacterium]
MRRAAQQGLSLLEMTFVMMAVASLAVALIYKTSDVYAKRQTLDTTALLRMADNQLRQYILEHGRLPCPDVDGDGIADAGASCTAGQKGYLPYKTLGMTDNLYVEGEVPMLYGVHRAGGIDFTSSSQQYQPQYANESNVTQNVAVAQRNIFDFCTQLAQLRDRAYGSSGLTVNLAPAVNPVYALAVPGLGDRSSQTPATLTGGSVINHQYDGVNESSLLQFAAPDTSESDHYDDRTAYRNAGELYDYFRCQTMTASIDLMMQSVTMSRQVRDMGDNTTKAVGTASRNDKLGILLTSWAMVGAVATIANSTEAGVMAGLQLAIATATCPIPPFATCALIPVYATALATAVTGSVLATAVSLVANTVALALQVTATILVDDVKARSMQAIAPTTVVVSTPPDKVAEKLSRYQTDLAAAKTAFNNTLVLPNPNDPAHKNNADSSAAALSTQINGVTDPTLKAALGDFMNGKADVCTTGCDASYTAQQVPLLDSSGEIVKNADGTLQYTTKYFRTTVAGVVQGIDTYYQAKTQNVPSGTGATIDGTPTDPSLLAAQQQLNSANAALASVPVPDVPTAQATMNTRISNYATLLANAAAFDSAHLAYQANTADATLQANRSAALSALRTSMGNPAWDYSGSTSLCTGGCGWMSNASSGRTGATAVNTYLANYLVYRDAQAAQKLIDTANNLSNTAWTSRSQYKTALCSNLSPSVTFIGGASPGGNPLNWDVVENLAGAAPQNLDCASGGGTGADLSADQAAARGSERTKYCTVGTATYDERLCAKFSSASSRTVVRDNQPVINTLIQKGIAK